MSCACGCGCQANCPKGVKISNMAPVDPISNGDIFATSSGGVSYETLKASILSGLVVPVMWPSFSTPKTSDYVIPSSMIIECISVDASGGDVTITLPLLNSGNYKIKKENSAGGNVIINASTNGSTLDGLATRTITGQYDVVEVISGATEWKRG